MERIFLFFFYIFTKKKKKIRKKFKFFFNLFLKKKQLYICQSTRLHKQRNKEKRKNIRSKYQKVHSLSSLNFSPDNPFDQGRNTMPRYQDTNLPKKWPAKLELNATNTDIHRRDLVRKQKYFFNGESQFDKKKKTSCATLRVFISITKYIDIDIDIYIYIYTYMYMYSTFFYTKFFHDYKNRIDCIHFSYSIKYLHDGIKK